MKIRKWHCKRLNVSTDDQPHDSDHNAILKIKKKQKKKKKKKKLKQQQQQQQHSYYKKPSAHSPTVHKHLCRSLSSKTRNSNTYRN